MFFLKQHESGPREVCQLAEDLFALFIMTALAQALFWSVNYVMQQ